MATNIILKRTSVHGNIPTIEQLSLGEVGINTFDGKMFIKKDDGSESIIEIKMNDFVPQTEIYNSLPQYTPNFGISDYFDYTLNQDSLMINPTDVLRGQTGYVIVKQDTVGGWNVNFDENYQFGVLGTPELDPAPNSVSVFKYIVIDDSEIYMEFRATYSSDSLSVNTLDSLAVNSFDVLATS